uniref:Class S F-box protein n=1 Tax=Solanum tuberosum TaxID=4113 RepID=M1CCQ5_SOLTU
MPYAPHIPQTVASSRRGHGDRWKYDPNVSFSRLVHFLYSFSVFPATIVVLEVVG